MFYTKAANANIIMTTREVNGKWLKPMIAEFSGESIDFEPHINPAGDAMYFGSFRALGDSDEEGILHQWIVHKTNGGWSESRPLGSPFANGF